jgi:hypothetical protein
LISPKGQRKNNSQKSHKTNSPSRGYLVNFKREMMEARAGVEPTYTDLQRINGHNLPYKTIGYKAIKCCVMNCAMLFKYKCYLSNDF